MKSPEPQHNQLDAKLSSASSSSATSQGSDIETALLCRSNRNANDTSLFSSKKPHFIHQTAVSMDPEGLNGRISERIDGVVSRLRGSFNSGKTRSISYRRQQLRNIERLLVENEKQLMTCLAQDLRKAPYEALCCEIDLVVNEVREALANLTQWTKTKTVMRHPLIMLDATASVTRMPYGLVLIISPWNYPLLLSLQPMIGAIAAGNTVILKPSELAPASARLLTTLLSNYLDPDCYQVINGDAQEMDSLLKGPHRFDYIFFTGSTHVGRIVYQAAAAKLTPVTLELGGKCPVWLDNHLIFDKMVWKRILWGRFLNAGQSCVAPDYVLTPQMNESDSQKLAELLRDIVKEFYGEDPYQSPDFGRIINSKNFTRLDKLLKNTSGRVIIGGQTESEDRYISPTIVYGVQRTDSLMQEELFAPILPIMLVKDFDEGLEYVLNGGHGRPLAAYIFSRDSDQVKRWKRSVITGSIGINETVLQISLTELPFGGVGESGLGLPYHGIKTFEVFSYERPVLTRRREFISENLTGVRYPPFTSFNLFLTRFVGRKWPVIIPPVRLSISKVIFFFTGFLFCFALNYILNIMK